jgi:hypothetical protein
MDVGAFCLPKFNFSIKLVFKNNMLYVSFFEFWRNFVVQKKTLIDFKSLKINDFSRPYLHTIFLFNDIAKSKLFNRATNYFNQLLPICRHIQVSFFLNVQFWKSLPPEIKANATLVFIFGGFDSRQLYYIFSQVPTAMNVRELIDFYRTLGKHDKLIVDCENGDIYLPDQI